MHWVPCNGEGNVSCCPMAVHFPREELWNERHRSFDRSGSSYTRRVRLIVVTPARGDAVIALALDARLAVRFSVVALTPAQPFRLIGPAGLQVLLAALLRFAAGMIQRFPPAA